MAVDRVSSVVPQLPSASAQSQWFATAVQRALGVPAAGDQAESRSGAAGAPLASAGSRRFDDAVQKERNAALDHHATDNVFRREWDKLAADPELRKQRQNEKIETIRKLDQFASSEIYQGTDGLGSAPNASAPRTSTCCSKPSALIPRSRPRALEAGTVSPPRS
jgi:hypothetical protein